MLSESNITSFVSDITQKNKELEYNKVGLRFSCKVPGMERFSQYLPRECALEKVVGVRVEFVVAR